MKTLLESFEILKNFPIAKTIVIKKENDLEKIPFPYYMKASLSEHKIEKEAVKKIENINLAKKEFKRLSKNFPKVPIVIQEQILGIEMIIGLKSDPVFDKLLMVGFGGTNAEILKDIGFLAVPLTKEDIENALKNLKLYPMLFKRQRYAVKKFIDLAFKVSKLNLKELDLNPVILNSKKAVIVDARIEP
ncbi:MAG: acetate--CoA ligase family protein [Candidatus Pacearchaeota archaeon]